MRRHQVGCHDAEGSGGVYAGEEVRVVADAAQGVRILDQDAGKVRTDGSRIKSGPVPYYDVDALPCGTGADDTDGLGMAGVRHKEGVGLGTGVPAHGDGFRRGRSFIQQGGIGDRQPRQGGHHGLEVHEHFQPSLGDFRLIGRIGRVPAWVFQNVAQDDGRSNGAVVSLADEGFQELVFSKDGTEFLQGFRFRFGGGKVQRGFHADVSGDDVRDEFFKRFIAEAFEHFPAFFPLGADMPAGKV